MEEFLGKRDYTGAMAVLEFNRHSGQGSEEVRNIKELHGTKLTACGLTICKYDRIDEKYSRTPKSISISQQDPNNYSDTETRALSSSKGKKKSSVTPGGHVAGLLRFPHGRLQTRDARI